MELCRDIFCPDDMKTKKKTSEIDLDTGDRILSPEKCRQRCSTFTEIPPMAADHRNKIGR